MARNEEWVSGYVLHSRPFRDTSLIVDILTQDYGRVSVVYRGVKSTNSKSNKARLLQPFQSLEFLWQGERELKTGKKIEPKGAGIYLTGTALYSALYINELLVRLLFKEDPHPLIFGQYEETIQQISQISSQDMAAIEVVLRLFEITLLAELGYEICFDKDAGFNDIEPSLNYRYDPELGFELAMKKIDPKISQSHFKGEQLLAIANQQWQEEETRKAAKRLLRIALAPHLGDKPLESRQLFKRQKV